MLLISMAGKSAAKREHSMLMSAGLGFSRTTDDVFATFMQNNTFKEGIRFASSRGS